LEATLTRGTSLFDHLEWQLKLSRGFSDEEEGVAFLIIGNLTPDGFWTRRWTRSRRRRVSQWNTRRRSCGGFRNSIHRRAARDLQECLLIQARYIGADDDVLVA